MVFQQCAVCQHVNDEAALRCEACHSDLRDADTVPAALITLPPPVAPAGALWLDDLGPASPPRPPHAPAGPPDAVAGDEPPPLLTLRDVVNATAHPTTLERAMSRGGPAAPGKPPPPARAAARATAQLAFPPLPPIDLPVDVPVDVPFDLPFDLPSDVPFEPEMPAAAAWPAARPPKPPPVPQAAHPPPAARPLPPPLAAQTLPPVTEFAAPSAPDAAPAPDDAGHAVRAAAREARRAAVRRARLRQAAATLGDTVPEVLVLDRDGAARDGLCNLLRGFGFGVHSLADVRRAMELRTTRHFVAAFVDIRLDAADGGLGIDLCRQWHAAGGTVLVLVSAPLNPVDRVRAEMLGFEGRLAKPVSRGDVARVLDAHGVALPSDARRL